MEKVFYVWLNDKPVKKFIVPKNGSIQTMYKNYIEYSKKKLKGKLEPIKDSNVIGGLYLTNGVDKLILKKEDYNEWIYKMNTEKMKKQIKRNEKINFENTAMYREIMSQI